jgi:hypothetical protein
MTKQKKSEEEEEEEDLKHAREKDESRYLQRLQEALVEVLRVI